MALPRTASLAQFAALNRWKRSYVTQLRKADRLVMEGDAVLVAESLARIRETESPAHAGVAARHAAKREAAAPQAQGAGQAAGVEYGGEAVAAPPAGDAAAAAPPEDEGFQYWRRRSERAKALSAERENAQAEGKLLDGGEVTAAIAAATTTLRARLESLPDVLGPQLAAVEDESRCRSILAEAIEHALEECSRQFSGIAREVSDA